MIRLVAKKDTEQIVKIYNHYITNSVATFAEELVTIEEMEDNINASVLWYVYTEGDRISGYAYASKWRKRSAYRFTVESSIYLDNNSTNKGIGTQLYATLLSELRKMEFHTVIGGMTLPNPACQSLHEKFGFKKVAHFNEVGYKFDRWLDVGYWELRM